MISDGHIHIVLNCMVYQSIFTLLSVLSQDVEDV